jgi:hypothetical protein
VGGHRGVHAVPSGSSFRPRVLRLVDCPLRSWANRARGELGEQDVAADRFRDFSGEASVAGVGQPLDGFGETRVDARSDTDFSLFVHGVTNAIEPYKYHS